MHAQRRMETWQRDRDEDLTLFHDMRARERKNFLCSSSDDIEASLSTRFGGPSGYRISATIPMYKGSSDLLFLDAEKSAYDWLLTPPGTPLFPSLNQDVPIIHFSRGLTGSALASRSSRLSSPQEHPPAVLHIKPSPCRRSTASSTGSTTGTSKGKSSSPSFTSPTSGPSPPSYRPTTPTGRMSATASRSTSKCSTPTLRRMNTSLAIQSSSASKVGSTNGRIQGKSLSPKLRRWEPSSTDFSELPPNLRTSLSDRSIQRGESLGSRYGGTAGYGNSSLMTSESNRSRQHLTSLDVSKGHSLSNSLDNNGCQLSKSSMKISSWEEDMEFAESIVSGSIRPCLESISKAAKNVSRPENTPIGKSILPAKRQTISTATSGDKKDLLNLTTRKSFERQMEQDQHRSSPRMFRPLLSSVPAASFYSIRSAGKQYRPTSSIPESSMTMSSNKGPKWDAKIVPENEISHGDEGKKYTSESGLCLETVRDLGDNGNQTTASFIDSAVNRDQVSDLGSKEIMKNEAKIVMSIEEEPREYAQIGTKAGEAKDRINALNGNQTFPDELKKYSHAVEGPSFLASCRQNIDAVQYNRENSDHFSSQEGLLVMSHTGKAQGSNSGCNQIEIFTAPAPEYSVGVGEHSLHSDSTVSETIGVNSLPTKILFGEKACIYEGKDMSVETKEVQGAALTVDAWEVTKTNANCHSSTSPICSLQFDTVEHQHLPLGYLTAEGGAKHALEQSSELSMVDFSKSDQFENNVFCSTADNHGQEDILSTLGVCAMMSDDQVTLQLHNADSDRTTCQKREMDTEKNHSKYGAAGNAEDDEPLEDTLCHKLEVKDARFLDDLSKKQQPGIASLTRNVTLEEATDMILFCSSIVHEIVYKAAATAMQMEDCAVAKNSGTKRERETFFNLSEAKCRNPSQGDTLRAGNRKWQPASSAVLRPFRYVQKQRMVHQRIPTVTVQENPMGRIENAVMGNHEEILTHTVTKVHKKKMKQARKVKCRCWCGIM